MAEKEPKFVPEEEKPGKEIDVEKLVEKWGPGPYVDVDVRTGRVLFKTDNVVEWVQYQARKAKEKREE